MVLIQLFWMYSLSLSWKTNKKYYGKDISLIETGDAIANELILFLSE